VVFVIGANERKLFKAWFLVLLISLIYT